jgi:hypothetical protein
MICACCASGEGAGLLAKIRCHWRGTGCMSRAAAAMPRTERLRQAAASRTAAATCLQGMAQQSLLGSRRTAVR